MACVYCCTMVGYVNIGIAMGGPALLTLAQAREGYCSWCVCECECVCVCVCVRERERERESVRAW